MTDGSFEDKAKKALDRAEENTGPEILSRLQGMRRDAVREMANRGQPRVQQWWGVPAPALAFATLVLVSGLLFFTQDRPPAPPGTIEDLELLASNPHLEFYEDLDFYAWLAEEDSRAG